MKAANVMSQEAIKRQSKAEIHLPIVTVFTIISFRCLPSHVYQRTKLPGCGIPYVERS